MPKLPIILMVLLLCSPAARAGEDPLTLLVDEYEEQCQKLQNEEIIPSVDEDLEAPSIFAPMPALDPQNVYPIEITPGGKKATVLIADFHCPGFGNLGCGFTGSCSSYIIVDDQVFEWGAGGRPMSARSGDEVVVLSSTAGYLCEDSDGTEGFGAAPCYVAAVWDDEQQKFWSQNGLVKVRGAFSAP
jgi:hypothetical protein